MVKTKRKSKKCDGDIVIKKRNAVLSRSHLRSRQKQLTSKSSFKERCAKCNEISSSDQDRSPKTESNDSKLDNQIKQNILNNISSFQNNFFRKTAEKLKKSKSCNVVIKQKDIVSLTDKQKLPEKSLNRRKGKHNKFNSIQVKPSKVVLNDLNFITQNDKTHKSENCASKKATIAKISITSKVCDVINKEKDDSPQKLNETKNKLRSNFSSNQKKSAEKSISDLNKNLEVEGSISLFDIQNVKVSLNNINLPRNGVPENRKIIKNTQKSNKNISYSATRSKNEHTPELQKTNNQIQMSDMLEENSIQETCVNSADCFNSNKDKFVEYKSNNMNVDSQNIRSPLNFENSSQNVFNIYSQASKNIHLKDLQIICRKLDISNYKSNSMKNESNTNNEESVHIIKQSKIMIKNENEENNSVFHLNKTTMDFDSLSDRLDIDKNSTEMNLELVTPEERFNEIKSENKAYSIASSSFNAARRNIHESVEIDKTEVINPERNIESVTMERILQRKHLRSPSWIKDGDDGDELPQFEHNKDCAVPETVSTNKGTWCVLS